MTPEMTDWLVDLRLALEQGEAPQEDGSRLVARFVELVAQQAADYPEPRADLERSSDPWGLGEADRWGACLALGRRSYPRLRQVLAGLGIEPGTVIPSLWQFWLPWALHLSQQQRSRQRPWIQGILGSQGAGKTTLGAVMQVLLEELGHRPLSFSLDDLYKTHGDRRVLRQMLPDLIWRGPPGTHDLELGIKTLAALAQGGTRVLIPRFDKALHQGSGDRIESYPVEGIDIVLFEGWFVGARSLEDARALEGQPLSLWCNARLREYLPLWQQLDSLMVMRLADYRWSKRWRIQAEQTLRSRGEGGMSDAEVEAFVEYFWRALHPRLYIDPLCAVETALAPDGTPSPYRADLVIEIGEQRQIQRIYAP